MMVALVAAVLAAAAGCRSTEAGGEIKVTVPAAFPPDVPLPEAALLRTAQDLGERGLNLTFESPVVPPVAAAALRQRLAQAGWLLVAEAVAPDGEFMSFRKEGRSVAIGVSPAERGSSIGVAYARLP
jgi:hypothetical protein